MNLDGVFAESLSCDPTHAQFSFPRFIVQHRIKMREQEVEVCRTHSPKTATVGQPGIGMAQRGLAHAFSMSNDRVPCPSRALCERFSLAGQAVFSVERGREGTGMSFLG